MRRRHRIERRATRRRHECQISIIAKRSRRNEPRHAIGDVQLLGLQAGEHQAECAALLRRRDQARRLHLLTAERIVELHPAHVLRCPFQRIAVMQVYVRESTVEHRKRLSGQRGALVEPADQQTAHSYCALERLEHVVAFDPLRGRRMRPARGRMSASNEAQSTRLGFADDELQPHLFRLRRGEPCVRVTDGERVVRSTRGPVRVGDVKLSLRVQLDERVRIIHDRRTSLRCGQEVVGEAERVANLVRRVLTAARHRELLGVDLEGRGSSRGEQAHVDVMVDQRAVGIHPHHRREDLAAARIAERRAH